MPWALAGRLAHGHVHLARDEAHRPRHAFHHGVRVVAGRLGAPAHDEGQVAQDHDEAGAQDARRVGQDAVGLQRAVDHAADEGRAAVDGAGLEGDGRTVHEHVAGDAPPMEVMVPSTTEGMTVRPAERLFDAPMMAHRATEMLSRRSTMGSR